MQASDKLTSEEEAVTLSLDPQEQTTHGIAPHSWERKS